MSKGTPRNLAHSIHQKLLNEAKHTGRPFNELLQYYAMERLLYRLSCSSHGGKFILKGALLLAAWRGPMYRPTQDIDLLGQISNDPAAIIAAFQDICRQKVQSDGLTFDDDRVTAQLITEDADYPGVRIAIKGRLGNARVDLHVDIGFADVIVPGPAELDYPAILDLPAPHLRVYSRQSVVAEKFQAMVKLGQLNSRMKDFCDLWFMARNFDFDGATLGDAIISTFAKRDTPMPAEPLALTTSFAQLEGKQIQWTAFLRRGQPAGLSNNFAEVVADIAVFLGPLAKSIASRKPFHAAWSPPGPWRK